MSIFSILFGKREPKIEPVIIHDSLGDFSLEIKKKLRIFQGKIDWCGEECMVYLEADGDELLTAHQSLEILHKLTENAHDWDKRLKEYSADQKADENEMIEIWSNHGDFESDVQPITKEKYISRMSLSFMDISANGNIYFDYDLDGMFTDHGEGIAAMISGEICSAGLQG